MMTIVVDALTVRWARSPSLLLTAWIGVLLAGSALTLDAPDVAALVALAAAITLGLTGLAVVRPRYEFDANTFRAVGLFGSTEITWNAVTVVSWLDVSAPRSGRGWAPVVQARGNAGRCRGELSEHRIGDVNAWLRQHQPEVRIDPKPPWRDRFGAWHVAEPGYDPVETMQSIRRSFVGPWEIAATSCEGGFHATQRLARSGEIVATRPVRTTLREAIADGVDLVRAALVEAESATE
jgi:hypothetical protein